MMTTEKLSRKTLRFFVVTVLCCVLIMAQETAKEARKLKRPWYTRYLVIGKTTLPFTPVTLALIFLSVFYLAFVFYSKPVYVVASHILLEHKDPEAEQKLEEWKQKIGGDAHAFAKYARAHSVCPSKVHGGNLGKFKPQNMTPRFDAICFDPNTPVEQAVGPVQTPFGWHLIYIHERQMEEQNKKRS
ncbi:peptidyl-prolyl cis-trans isomerase SurA [Fistulifera solaris]|uniref:Peptidyl-prolyl cis-trans isomerase n=1 Tax=Fistulifera solaris TaxID=1519565 RepID=A0A1Z5KB98_FISSO|nr:peptidyl-prolyl cis-trans isomerase SurA [Fistulifera solaris]|eukprot:GAX23422.1 peptidyl-prolyl cis-trans isomerase SurA [Fistulifera solaris]